MLISWCNRTLFCSVGSGCFPFFFTISHSVIHIQSYWPLLQSRYILCLVLSQPLFTSSILSTYAILCTGSSLCLDQLSCNLLALFHLPFFSCFQYFSLYESHWLFQKHQILLLTASFFCIGCNYQSFCLLGIIDLSLFPLAFLHFLHFLTHSLKKKMISFICTRDYTPGTQF
ncbi:hypothetical protein BD560DRAFT_63816 [Blakeslea trispora]|nr:hypothetical protein BD560DRAFT_63816 [Blakeslea trispora]